MWAGSRTTGGCSPPSDVSDELPLLWQYSFSNYNEKARWALDFKGISHHRRSLLPAGPRAMRFSRGEGTLPVLDLEGERFVDSTRIIAALEERFPEQPLYPADPHDRRRALELEDFFDENAGHDMRRIGFWEQQEDRAYALDFLTTDQPAAARLLMRPLMPLGWRYVSNRYGFNQEAFERSKDVLVAALDRIEAERNGGAHLVGDRFSVADLTAAALLYPMVWPPEYQYYLPEAPPSDFLGSVRGHPAMGWISETWRRHRGCSAEVS
jgi:glutathione S-transferase